MKSRTLISFCQSPGWKPSHAAFTFSPAIFSEIVVAIAVLLACVCSRSQSEQIARVPGYHQRFVGRNHPRRDLALRRGDSRTPTAVRLRVKLDAQPARSLADSAAYLG